MCSIRSFEKRGRIRLEYVTVVDFVGPLAYTSIVYDRRLGTWYSTIIVQIVDGFNIPIQLNLV